MIQTANDNAARFLDAPWLDAVPVPTRLTIWEALRERTEPARATILELGRPNDRLWFVAAGSVAVERPGPDGRPEVLAELHAPAIFGTTTFFRRSKPSLTLRAVTPVRGWTLDRAAFDRLRADHPEASEALALAAVQVLAERFDQLDERLTTLMAEHHDDHPRANEWAAFRSRLFEEPAA